MEACDSSINAVWFDLNTLIFGMVGVGHPLVLLINLIISSMHSRESNSWLWSHNDHALSRQCIHHFWLRCSHYSLGVVLALDLGDCIEGKDILVLLHNPFDSLLTEINLLAYVISSLWLQHLTTLIAFACLASSTLWDDMFWNMWCAAVGVNTSSVSKTALLAMSYYDVIRSVWLSV